MSYKLGDGKGKMKIELLTNEQEWDDFVASCPDGTFYHTSKWKQILEEGFGYETVYYVIRNAGEIKGVCPFVLKKEFGFFRVLDSLPHSDFGGPLIQNNYCEEAAFLIKKQLKELAENKGITYAELRCTTRALCEQFIGENAKIDTSHGTMNLNLFEKPGTFIWDKVFSNKSGQRTNIRRIERDNFQNREAKDENDLKLFYDLYFQNVKSIGGIALPYTFFNKMFLLLYPHHFNFLLTVRGEQCIGAEVFFIYGPKNTIYQSYVGLDKRMGARYHLYNYLGWGLIQWAEKNGFDHVSFGGTPSDPNSPQYSEKKDLAADFNQHYFLFLPFNKRNYWIFESEVKLGRKVKKLLPEKLRQALLKWGIGLRSGGTKERAKT